MDLVVNLVVKDATILKGSIIVMTVQDMTCVNNTLTIHVVSLSFSFPPFLTLRKDFVQPSYRLHPFISNANLPIIITNWSCLSCTERIHVMFRPLTRSSHDNESKEETLLQFDTFQKWLMTMRYRIMRASRTVILLSKPDQWTINRQIPRSNQFHRSVQSDCYFSQTKGKQSQ